MKVAGFRCRLDSVAFEGSPVRLCDVGDGWLGDFRLVELSSQSHCVR